LLLRREIACPSRVALAAFGFTSISTCLVVLASDGVRLPAAMRWICSTRCGYQDWNCRYRSLVASAGNYIEQPEQRIRTVTAVLRNYESQYVVNHRKNSAVIVQNRSKPLVKALGNVLLPDVTPKLIVDYMDQRQGDAKAPATGPLTWS
jgi:hypothetical protein